jgi:hypothetical protein
MPGWRTAPVNGVWRLENPDFHGHCLSVRRSRAGAYRAYLDGRMLGLWGDKETAMAAAEMAADARESHKPAVSFSRSSNSPRNRI